MYKLHLLQHPDWHRTGTSYCYCYIFEIFHDYNVISKIIPSFFTIKEGSTSHLGLLSSGEKKETALPGAQNRYALRLSDHQRSSPCYAGWDRLISLLHRTINKFYFILYLQLC